MDVADQDFDHWRKGTGVIRHHVENDLEALPMRVIHKRPEIGECAEVLLDLVEVGGAIAVVIGDGLAVVHFFAIEVVVVVVEWRHPDRRHAERLEIGKFLPHACEIAAVVVAALRAIDDVGLAGRTVVRRVTVRKAVGHDEVHHIIRTESLKAPRGRKWRRHGERYRRSAPGRANGEGIRTRCHATGNTDVDERVRAGGIGRHSTARQFRTFEARTTKVGAAHQQPNGIDGVIAPPVWRLDLGDGWRLRLERGC